MIASKISSTLSSVGSPSFALPANECAHGDLGSISKKDVLILISNSGETQELKPVIQYANRNKITLIAIVSKKNSILFNAADIKLVIPEVKESGHGIVPTSSTTAQLALVITGDASMKLKNFGKLDFKKFHPSGSLGAQLKTVEDLMVTGNKIPFISESANMKKALKLITDKKLGVLIVLDKNKNTSGIITDGQIRRSNQKNKNLNNLKVKNVMTKNPISVQKNTWPLRHFL